jgi:hypothetical protein
MSSGDELEKEDFGQVRERFELLEMKRQHQNSQIHKNMYLSLIILAGIIAIFGQSQNNIILLLASLITAATFSGLGVWTYLYATSRTSVVNEKQKIFEQYGDYSTYFKFVDNEDDWGDVHDKNDVLHRWKFEIMMAFYVFMTGGSVLTMVIITIELVNSV